MSGFGLVLGGGGARGLAHLGVWAVLEEAGLRPQALAGTSMGGLVAAFIAAGASADELRQVSNTLSWRQLLDWRFAGDLRRSHSFGAWLAAHLPPTFEELRLPLAVTATDLLTGRQVYLRSGDLHAALRATTAYPGAIDPVPLGDMLLADGGILNQVPVDAALFLGVRRVVAVDVTAAEPLALPERERWRWRQGAPLGPVQVLRRAVDVMQAQLTDARLSLYRPDVLLHPKLEGVDLQSFRRGAQAIAAGEAAARADLARLHGLAP